MICTVNQAIYWAKEPHCSSLLLNFLAKVRPGCKCLLGINTLEVKFYMLVVSQ